MTMHEYIRRRNKLVIDMDVEGIKELHTEANIPLPTTDFSITAGMHIVKVRNSGFSVEEKDKSIKWLTDNGFPEHAQYVDII